jgi:hypothetical protein
LGSQRSCVPLISCGIDDDELSESGILLLVALGVLLSIGCGGNGLPLFVEWASPWCGDIGLILIFYHVEALFSRARRTSKQKVVRSSYLRLSHVQKKRTTRFV